MNSEEKEETALAASTKKVTSRVSEQRKKNKQTRKSKNHIQCCVCSKKGHYAREYPQRRDKVHTQQHHDESASYCALLASSKEADSHERGTIKVNKTKAGYTEPTREEERALLNANSDKIWFTDTGASAHITFRREWLVKYRPKDHGSIIVLGDGNKCPVVGDAY